MATHTNHIQRSLSALVCLTLLQLGSLNVVGFRPEMSSLGLLIGQKSFFRTYDWFIEISIIRGNTEYRNQIDSLPSNAKHPNKISKR